MISRGKTHIVDFAAGVARTRLTDRTGPAARAVMKEIGGRIKRSRRRLDLMSALATGWLPWGVEWDIGFAPKTPDDPRCGLLLVGRRYVLCCGHALGRKEAQDFVDAGLLQAGPPDTRDGTVTLVITEAGRYWLSENW
jgi:hypothetical protein